MDNTYIKNSLCNNLVSINTLYNYIVSLDILDVFSHSDISSGKTYGILYMGDFIIVNLRDNRILIFPGYNMFRGDGVYHYGLTEKEVSDLLINLILNE
jgi:hypothetical protein